MPTPIQPPAPKAPEKEHPTPVRFKDWASI
jgi:hypothetical protein